MSNKSETLNITDLIDQRPLGSFQLFVFALCFVVALMDGIDSQVIAVAGPQLQADLKVPPSLLGLVFSASSWGFLVGALLIGPCADRWGRKIFLIASMLVFSLCTIVTPLAGDYQTVIALRFLTGIGLGGAAPCFISIGTEYAPRHMRARLVSILWVGMPGGGAIAAFLGSALLPSYGWHLVFYIVGGISLAALFVVAVLLPESIVHLANRGGEAARIRRLATRLAPSSVSAQTTHFIVTEERSPGLPVKHLLTNGRAPATLLLWVAFIIDFFVLIALLVWMPTLLKLTGMSVSHASSALGASNIGGIVGCLVAGWWIDRFGPYRFLIPVFVAAAVIIALIGYVTPDVVPVLVLATLAGLLIGGAGSGLVALAAMIYPAYMRSTGVGWGAGLARIGGALGPVFSGGLLAAGFAPTSIFVILGIAALPAALAMVAMQFFVGRRATNPASAGVSSAAPHSPDPEEVRA